MDELAAASGENVKNEPSGCQSMLRYFESLISIPCGASIPRSILNILGELLDCKSESSYIDCLNPDDIDCMVYCILTQ